jgi:peptide/nickel transport system substrate-binding protein
MVRRKLVQTVALVGIAGATVITPFASHQVSAHSTHAKIATLVVGWDVSDAKSIDPGRVYEFSGVIAAHSIYESLITYKGTSYTPVPDLAKSWTVTGGGSVFTFKLRQGVKFASGNPVTAQDVLFSYNRAINLKDNPAPLFGSIKSVTAPDASTVRITLKAPDVSFLAVMVGPNFGVVDSKTVIAQGGTDAANASTADKATTYLNSNSAGSGPYVLKEWTRNTRIVLERNPNYWGPAPYFQEVILNGVKDAQTQALQLKKGDADIAFSLTSDQLASLKSDSNVKVNYGPTPDYVYMAMNISPALSKPLSSPLVRQAIRYAIDYNGIINKLLNGAGTQIASVIPLGYIGNSPAQNAAARIITNVTKAKALLAQAGYPNGFTVQMTYLNGYVFDGIDPNSLAAKIINDLKAVGITVTPDPEQTSVGLAKYRARKAQIALMPWGADYLDAYDNLSYFGPGGNVGLRVNYKSDGNLAAMIAKADTIADPATRGAMYNQVQTQMLKTGPYVVVVEPSYPVGVRANIKGYAYAPIWKMDFASLSK